MSKARYSMGNKQVSTLQYASEMEPLVRIHVRSGIKSPCPFKITVRYFFYIYNNIAIPVFLTDHRTVVVQR